MSFVGTRAYFVERALSLDQPSYGPMMQHCRDPQTRATLHRAYMTRASRKDASQGYVAPPRHPCNGCCCQSVREPSPYIGRSGFIAEYHKCNVAPLTLTRAEGRDNTDIMARILNLRKEKAMLLGYNTYAELSVAQKMAKTVGQVQQLLDELHAAAKPAADREVAELMAFAKARGCVLRPGGDGLKPQPWVVTNTVGVVQPKLGASNGSCWLIQHLVVSQTSDINARPTLHRHEGGLRPSDIAYWSEQHKAHHHGVRDEELRPFFCLPNVLNGMCSLAQDLFGVRIEVRGLADMLIRTTKCTPCLMNTFACSGGSQPNVLIKC